MLLLVGVGRREGGVLLIWQVSEGWGEAADDDLYTCSHRTLGSGVTTGSVAYIAQEAGSVTPVSN